MDRVEHWEHVYATRQVAEVSWYERRPATSLSLVEALDLPRDAGIVDIGGGASALVDELVAAGFRDLTVLDVSSTALELARARLAASSGAEAAAAVHWVAADVCRWEPGRRFDLWHDRAVFHFLVDPADRARYRSTVGAAVAPGGHVVMATFAADGPTTCSGLPVARYDATELASELGPAFDLAESRRELHTTPAGTAQSFTWVVLRRRHDRTRRVSRR